MSLILGIDEAGRGSLCGPLIIAGAMIQEEELPKLEQMGIKDSKLLTPKRREKLRKELEPIIQSFVLEVTPKEIDENNLNHLELDKFAEIILQAGAKKVIIDAMEANTEGVKQKLLARVGSDIEIISENKADYKYPLVGAASIFAKTIRDEKVAELREKYGDMGSGYPSDPKTKRFMDDWMKENHFFPVFVRKKWSTLKKYAPNQKKLGDF